MKTEKGIREENEIREELEFQKTNRNHPRARGNLYIMALEWVLGADS